MKNKAYDIAAYQFSKDEPLLFDTNIWLYLFPAPSGQNPHAPVYSSALKKMQQAGVHLALDVMILSEYLNRYCRIEWKANFPQTSFKYFRSSPSFNSIGQNAATYAHQILKLCTPYDHPFAAVDIKQILLGFSAGNQDFNDALLADSCRQRGWKLVTHDGDFTQGGIEILTANSKLQVACNGHRSK
ncbi:PIN domain-containing protein [Candidatus Methylospira mobilis]|uniref:PIN domain-containing protein n=1 Tax=Candidatus Methylospira mobilis TaxID=1808979 RepID=A0A5Q0BRB7_9GAMM|nr:PIN domain-containing protein [Candidatus Methylospira mobilis]QFY44841.1 PIN domain-containing protein [Candidatus Methylospira mobilis]WNV05612.1 PIN domain-containing protein [Candidatus Methylospira mobilis]